MSVKSRSKTFKPGDAIESVDWFYDSEISGCTEVINDNKIEIRQVSKRLTITITYERDDKTTGT